MKKKILFIITILLTSLSLLSCGKDNKSDFQKLVKSIYDSEEIIAGYTENSIIKDKDLEVYNKTTEFKIARGKQIKSEVKIVEKKLSTSGDKVYDETTSSYTTIDNMKFTIVNGTTFQNEFTMPTYYLTFVLSEDFLEKDYSLIKEENNYTLNAKVLDNKISSLFLNKSLANVKNLSIEIIVDNGNLQTFNASYTTSNGFDCSINTSYVYGKTGEGVAVFHLEGGICQNTKDKVSYVYSFNGNKVDTLIVEPNKFETEEKDMIQKNGYHIEGWYRTKVTNPDGTVEYMDKWDFENDRMTTDGVELYAKWEINRVYTYELYYKDKDGNEVFLDKYEVSKGEKFSDKFMKNSKVEGYTTLGYLNEDGDAWNSNFKHPGGDSDVAIKVYANLIEGEYTLVDTAKKFTRAVSKGQNVYLLCDIDLDGDEICFDTYSGIIEGNGYTISNFEIDYDAKRSGLKGELDETGKLDTQNNHVYISLFFELKDATIRNVTFDKVLVDVNASYTNIKYLVVSPFAVLSSNTKIENVEFNANIKITKTPDGCETKIVTDSFFYKELESVSVDDKSKVDITGDLPSVEQ
jgi:hypothetical protein